MKIVQINAIYKITSTGRTTYEMHNWLKENKHESIVFCAHNESNDDKDIIKIGSNIDHKIHSLLSHITGLQGYFSTYNTKKILRIIDDINPDVVILRILHSNFINIPLLLKHLANTNILTTIVLHDCWLYTGYCNFYSNINCQKWQYKCNNCPLLNKEGNPSWFFDMSSKVFSDRCRDFNSIKKLAVVGVSDWVKNEAMKSPVFYKAKAITRIYNWIDLKVFCKKNVLKLRNTYGYNPNEFIILGVATLWSKRKGLDKIIEIARCFNDCKILLIGEINTTDILPDNLITIGLTNNVSELVDYYNIADVFVSSSSQETFGKVIAEAMACGTPCIVNNATAMPELVKEGCGYVVNNNLISEYCKYISIIREKGKAYYTEQCLNNVNNNFDKNKNMNEYINLFSKMLAYNE